MSDFATFNTFRIDQTWFGVPVQEVQEVVRYLPITPVPGARPGVAGLFSLRGEILTAIELRRCLGLAPRPPAAAPLNLVVRQARETVSLLVDEVGDVIRLQDTLFEPTPETVSGAIRPLLRGTYKLDRHLLLVLHTHAVLDTVSGDNPGDAR
jgi:purine-binding chemotaxis protein CheW